MSFWYSFVCLVCLACIPYQNVEFWWTMMFLISFKRSKKLILYYSGPQISGGGSLQLHVVGVQSSGKPIGRILLSYWIIVTEQRYTNFWANIKRENITFNLQPIVISNFGLVAFTVLLKVWRASSSWIYRLCVLIAWRICICLLLWDLSLIISFVNIHFSFSFIKLIFSQGRLTSNVFLIGLNLLRIMSEYLNPCYLRNVGHSFTARGRN